MAKRARLSEGPHAEKAQRRRPAAMADVARLAGVSHQTVSRVINGSERVAPATRTRVQEAMRMLDYRPSTLARALVTGRSRTIGVIGFDTTLYGPTSTLYGIERSAHEADYLTSVVSMPELNRESARIAIERLRRHSVEGILAVAPHAVASSALAQTTWDVPIVAVEAGPDEDFPSVAIDQYAGAAAATRHLLDLGHRTIVHIGGPPHWQETQIRLAAWREAMLDAGARPPAPLYGDWSAQAGYERGAEVAAMRDVTAIFASNDQMALGVLCALDEADRRVPRDVSVVGFDDIPEAAFFKPPLTTVRQEFIEVGRRGFELLQGLIEDREQTDTKVVIPAELLIRGSTAPPQ